jgi:hypothetical protein
VVVAVALAGAAIGAAVVLSPGAIAIAAPVIGLATAARGPWRGFYGVIAVLVLVPGTLDLPVPGDVRPVLFAAALATAGATLLIHESAFEETWHYAWVGAPIAVALTIGGLGGLLDGASPYSMVTGAAPLAVLALLLPYALACGRSRSEVPRRCALVLMWLGAALSVLAAYQVVVGRWPVVDDYAVKTLTSSRYPDRAGAIFGHPAVYATFAGAMAIVAIVTRVRLWPLALGANLLGLVLTGTRGATAAFVVAIAFCGALLVLRGRLPRSVSMVPVLAAVAALAILIPSGSGTVADRLEGRLEATSSAFASRTQVAQAGWNGITDNAGTFLVGRGPGAESRLFDDQGFRVSGQPGTFDDAYLTIWYELGLLGLLALAALLVAGIALPGPPLGRVLLAFLAVNLLTYDGFRWPLVQGIALLAVSLGVGAGSPRSLPVKTLQG